MRCGCVAVVVVVVVVWQWWWLLWWWFGDRNTHTRQQDKVPTHGNNTGGLAMDFRNEVSVNLHE